MPTDSTPGNPRVMVDTNILIYCFTPEDVYKQQVAVRLVETLLVQRRLDLSAQILNEFYVNLTRASRKVRLSHDEAVAALRRLVDSGRILPVTEAVTFRALA